MSSTLRLRNKGQQERDTIPDAPGADAAAKHVEDDGAVEAPATQELDTEAEGDDDDDDDSEPSIVPAFFAVLLALKFWYEFLGFFYDRGLDYPYTVEMVVLLAIGLAMYEPWFMYSLQLWRLVDERTDASSNAHDTLLDCLTKSLWPSMAVDALLHYTPLTIAHPVDLLTGREYVRPAYITEFAVFAGLLIFVALMIWSGASDREWLLVIRLMPQTMLAAFFPWQHTVDLYEYVRGGRDEVRREEDAAEEE